MSRHPASPRRSPAATARPTQGGHEVLARAVMAATWYLEVRAGRRPVTHLQAWASPPLARQLDGMVRRRRREGTGAASFSLVRVWAQRPAGRVNVVVVLHDGTRALPVVVALEPGPQGPQLTALGLPEDRVTDPTGGTAPPPVDVPQDPTDLAPVPRDGPATPTRLLGHLPPGPAGRSGQGARPATPARQVTIGAGR